MSILHIRTYACCHPKAFTWTLLCDQIIRIESSVLNESPRIPLLGDNMRLEHECLKVSPVGSVCQQHMLPDVQQARSMLEVKYKAPCSLKYRIELGSWTQDSCETDLRLPQQRTASGHGIHKETLRHDCDICTSLDTSRARSTFN